MARPLGIEYYGALYHATSRGNEQKAIFKDDGDRELFLTTLGQVSERFRWLCHGYLGVLHHSGRSFRTITWASDTLVKRPPTPFLR